MQATTVDTAAAAARCGYERRLGQLAVREAALRARQRARRERGWAPVEREELALGAVRWSRRALERELAALVAAGEGAGA